MPITADQALSAAFRAATRSLHVDPVKDAGAEYAEFLVHIREEAMGAEAKFRNAEALRGTDPRAFMKAQQDAYLHALRFCVAALLGLGHFPFLEAVEIALPGERMEA